MSKILRYGRAIFAATLCTALAACQTTTGTQANLNDSTRDRAFCEERPLVCALIGAVVIGGVVAIASNNRSKGSVSTGDDSAGNVSDIRLKTDVQFVEQLENGINLYAFRYTGDERVFVGVNAAEIQADPRHAHAVRNLGGDFLGVDYQALGLELVNEAEMRKAGSAALARALAS
ncbi:hypothetical protein ACFPLB_10225 [Aquamicrobium segne]|uniref:Lipoprotein n=1 Tax=Aquamicrobium segne TaxID=469547 RepID=A0ABW0GY04_9HYPH